MGTQYRLTIHTEGLSNDKCVSTNPQDLINVLQEEIRSIALKARVENATKFLAAARDLGMTAKIVEDGYLVAEARLGSDGAVCLSNINSDYPELRARGTVQSLVITLDSYGYHIGVEI